jgi:hypothetical protein
MATKVLDAQSLKKLSRMTALTATPGNQWASSVTLEWSAANVLLSSSLDSSILELSPAG